MEGGPSRWSLRGRLSGKAGPSVPDRSRPRLKCRHSSRPSPLAPSVDRRRPAASTSRSAARRRTSRSSQPGRCCPRCRHRRLIQEQHSPVTCYVLRALCNVLHVRCATCSCQVRRATCSCQVRRATCGLRPEPPIKPTRPSGGGRTCTRDRFRDSIRALRLRRGSGLGIKDSDSRFGIGIRDRDSGFRTRD